MNDDTEVRFRTFYGTDTGHLSSYMEGFNNGHWCGIKWCRVASIVSRTRAREQMFRLIHADSNDRWAAEAFRSVFP